MGNWRNGAAFRAANDVWMQQEERVERYAAAWKQSSLTVRTSWAARFERDAVWQSGFLDRRTGTADTSSARHGGTARSHGAAGSTG